MRSVRPGLLAVLFCLNLVVDGAGRLRWLRFLAVHARVSSFLGEVAMNNKLRHLSFCSVVVMLGFAPLGVTPAQGTPPAFRVWTDATGQFQVEAQLIGVDGEAVQLRCKDGRAIKVPLGKMSPADVQFVRSAASLPAAKPKVGVATAERLETLAKRHRTAKQALADYRLFLSDPVVPVEQKEAAKKRLAYWEKAAKDGLQRVGSEWLSPKEVEELEAKEDEFFSEAMRLYEADAFDLAIKKFKAASNINPAGIRTDFHVGILTALFGRDAVEAEKQFDKCVKRRESLGEELSPIETANLIASLNNLAVTEVRQRKVSTALRHWEDALELGPPSPELVQNLGRLGHLSSPEVKAKLGARSVVTLTSGERRRWGDLYAKAARTIAGDVFDPGTGWLYIPFVRERSSSSTGAPKPKTPTVNDDGRAFAHLRVVGFGTGFVVSPNYILTNAHVAHDADGFFIIESTRPDAPLPANTHAVAKSGDFDLAVLHCPGVTASPIPLVNTAPQLGGEIRIMGYPDPERFGSSLKVTRGIISALPPHTGMGPEYKDYLLYDGLTNPGSSGGPSCNINGSVVAVHTARLRSSAVDVGFGAGVPAANAVAFLESSISAFTRNRVAASGVQTWEAATRSVAASTVQILVLKEPVKVSLGDRFADARGRKPQWDAYEDPWCMACHGRGEIECRNRHCMNGTVGSHRMEVQRFPDGAMIQKRVPIRVTCRTCRGKGRVECPHCTYGIDPVFFD